MKSSQPPHRRLGRRDLPSSVGDSAGFSRALDEAAAHAAAGRLEAAAQVYRRLERQAPSDVRAAYSLAGIDIRQGRLARARRRLQAVVALEPALAAAQHNLGAVCQRMGAWEAAAEAYGRALELQPQATATRAGLATALAALGQGAEAIGRLRALAADPAQRWSAFTRIALIDPAAIGDDDLAGMRAAASDDAVDSDSRTGLFFALGEVLELRGLEAEAFAAFAAGNRLKNAALDSAAVAGANAAAANYVGSPSAAPIFVVGFPRSGSTLIEQILASHPDVQGLGETGVLPALAAQGYPTGAAGFRDLAARYLAAMGERGWDGTSRFVDKTLENYLHLGLIQVLFPRSVILHAVRDPVDTGFACYRQLFTSGNETLYDLAEIGAEYVRYRQLMAHWSAVLPGRAVEVSYEALVSDPDVQIPDLVARAGLAWDPATLRFHERAGGVATASASQVRRPIYQSSVRRWRRHAERLQPLVDALGEYSGIWGKWRE
jgi:tetratricopeptide (TPR) repeat protein